MARKLYKAAILYKWLSSKGYTPVGFMAFAVWIHVIMVMVAIGLRIGWLFTFAILFSFPMTYLLYIGWFLFWKKESKTELTEAEKEEAANVRKYMED